MKSLNIHLLLLLFFSLSIFQAFSYTYTQVGVNSNFLFYNNKLYFVQSDSSLTVLDIFTGNVLVRKKDRNYSGTLKKYDWGILVLQFGNIFLLDLTSLDIKWETETHYEPNIVGQYLVSYDGNGLVECRNIKTGKIYWTYDLPGALDIIVEKEKVLLFRSAVYDGVEGIPAVVLLDLKTGNELFYNTPPPGIHYINIYFDGNYIYLESGSYTGVHTPNITRYDKGRPSARFEYLLIWDINGNEIERIKLPVGFKKKANNSLKFFTINNKTFANGRVFKQDEEIILDKSTGLIQKDITMYKYRVSNSIINIYIDKNPFEYNSEYFSDPIIEFISINKKWKGVLPYLIKNGEISAITINDDLLFIGTNIGQVECIDVQNAVSKWIYVFPTIRHTMSYSSPWGLPPYLYDSAQIYVQENKNIMEIKGFRIEGSNVLEQNYKIISDPEPANPYKMIWLKVLIATIWAIIPLIIYSLIIIYIITKKKSLLIIALFGIIFFLFIFTGFFFNRVSLINNIIFKVSLSILCVLNFVFAIKSKNTHKAFKIILIIINILFTCLLLLQLLV